VTNGLDPNSFAARAHALMARNPEEAYSSKDLSIKFDMPLASVDALLKPHVKAGLFAFNKGEWSIGATLPASFLPQNGVAPAKVVKATRARVELPDLATLVSKPFTELPEWKNRNGSEWRNALFDTKLSKPGLCVEGLDERLRTSLASTIKQRRDTTRERYALRQAPDKSIGVYRLPDALDTTKPPTKSKATK